MKEIKFNTQKERIGLIYPNGKICPNINLFPFFLFEFLKTEHSREVMRLKGVTQK